MCGWFFFLFVCLCFLFFKVEKLKTEVAKQANQQQRKVKERAAEAKRIQDLERQVHAHSAGVYLGSSELLSREGQLSHSAVYVYSGHVTCWVFFPKPCGN